MVFLFVFSTGISAIGFRRDRAPDGLELRLITARDPSAQLAPEIHMDRRSPREGPDPLQQRVQRSALARGCFVPLRTVDDNAPGI